MKYEEKQQSKINNQQIEKLNKPIVKQNKKPRQQLIKPINTKLGITGTRYQPSQQQLVTFEKLIQKLNPNEFHHGCCQGVDTLTSQIVKKLDNNSIPVKIIAHPPLKKDLLGKDYEFTETRKEKDFLKRNHDIVDESSHLIVIPVSDKEVKRSGTWATMRYALKKNKNVYIIKVNGEYYIPDKQK